MADQNNNIENGNDHNENEILGVPVWVMPHYRVHNEETTQWLDEAIASINNQTDTRWHLVIVDDSSEPSSRAYLQTIRNRHAGKVTILLKSQHQGAGRARNTGVEWAHRMGAPFVLFLDADDRAHPRRLEKAREIFDSNKNASLIYSTFQVIDENSLPVAVSRLSQSLVEILESHQNPVQGPDAWLRIGIETGYTTLTSTTSVRTELAVAHPFPGAQASEDAHTWMRIGAAGHSLIFSDTPSCYRIPQRLSAGSSSRSHVGRHNFYAILSATNEDGFRQALKLAIQNGKVNPKDEGVILVKFYVRLAETLGKEREYDLVAANLEKARALNSDATTEYLQARGCNQTWFASAGNEFLARKSTLRSIVLGAAFLSALSIRAKHSSRN